MKKDMSTKDDSHSEAYSKQDKAPRKGVKADDADEYQNSKMLMSDLSVESHQAYAKQAKAPQGRGNRGPSQADGPAINYWDKSVESHNANSEQCHWGDSDNNSTPNKGFKLGAGTEYLGHFAKDENLMRGHNDGGIMDMIMGSGDSKPSPSPSPNYSDEDTSTSNHINRDKAQQFRDSFKGKK